MRPIAKRQTTREKLLEALAEAAFELAGEILKHAVELQNGTYEGSAYEAHRALRKATHNLGNGPAAQRYHNLGQKHWTTRTWNKNKDGSWDQWH